MSVEGQNGGIIREEENNKKMILVMEQYNPICDLHS